MLVTFKLHVMWGYSENAFYVIYFEPWKSVGGSREAHANIRKGRRNKLRLIVIRSATARVNGERGGGKDNEGRDK